MKFSHAILIIILLSVSTITSGQNYMLKVLASKGDNQVRKANGEWEKLRTGASLVSTDLIKVGKDAYIGFVHHSGYALEWKKEGTFPVTEIESRMVTTSSLVSKYADFLASKSNTTSSGNIAGGVHRGGEEALYLIAPVNAMVMNETIKLNWTENESSAYTLRVKNLYGAVLTEIPLETNSFTLDFSSNAIGKEKTLLIQIIDQKDKMNTSQEIALVRLDEKQSKNLTKIHDELTEGLNLQSALGQYILAGFYEESKLILEAMNSYEKAAELAPEVIEFQESLNSFLTRNQLLRK